MGVMRKIIIIISFFLLSLSTHAQILLKTKTVGSVGRTSSYFYYSKWDPPRTTCQWTRWFTNPIHKPNRIVVSHDYRSTGRPRYYPGTLTYVYTEINRDVRGVMEFFLESTLQGDPFPTDKMTTYNWRAYLKGLQITYAKEIGDVVPLKLYDLRESDEDGTISYYDYENQADPISPVFSVLPDENTMVNAIDITEALRHDLFLSDPNVTSGFIFNYVNPAECELKFDRHNPFIEIVFNDESHSDIGIKIGSYSSPANDIQHVFIKTSDNRLDPQPMLDCVLVMEYQGQFYFYPGMNTTFQTFPVGSSEDPLFSFPSLEGQASPGQIVIYTAIINPSTNNVLSNISSLAYTWH